MNFNDMLNKAKNAKEKAAEIKDKAVDLTDKVTELTGSVTELGWEKVNDAIDATLLELQSLRPILEKSGFIVGELDLLLAIPPGVEVKIKRIEKGWSALEELEQTEGLTNMQLLIIRALKNTYALSGMFEKYNYSIGGVSIMVSFPPKVHVHLKHIAAHNKQLPPSQEPAQLLIKDLETN
ncbi:MAG: hypothetical protein AB1489_29540 [Acidobacteriota bacterium]